MNNNLNSLEVNYPFGVCLYDIIITLYPFKFREKKIFLIIIYQHSCFYTEDRLRIGDNDCLVPKEQIQAVKFVDYCCLICEL